MFLTPSQTFVMILAIAAGTMLTRFAPFLLFPESKTPPEFVRYLGRVLPPAVIGLLVVYCLKGVELTTKPFALPEVIAVLGIVLLHRWKHNTLLSIAGGTLLYMLLTQLVFA